MTLHLNLRPWAALSNFVIIYPFYLHPLTKELNSDVQQVPPVLYVMYRLLCGSETLYLCGSYKNRRVEQRQQIDLSSAAVETGYWICIRVLLRK